MFTEVHSKEILSTMNTLRKADKLCDVVLRVDNKCFPAHRIVLAASSDYFNAMFNTGVSINTCVFLYVIFLYRSSIDIFFYDTYLKNYEIWKLG